VKHYFCQLLIFRIITTILLHHSDYLMPATLPKIISTVKMTSFAPITIPTGTSTGFTPTTASTSVACGASTAFQINEGVRKYAVWQEFLADLKSSAATKISFSTGKVSEDKNWLGFPKEKPNTLKKSMRFILLASELTQRPKILTVLPLGRPVGQRENLAYGSEYRLYISSQAEP